jgi:hypothetical protein
MSGMHTRKIEKVWQMGWSEDAGNVRRFALIKLVDTNLPSPRLSPTRTPMTKLDQHADQEAGW